MIRKELYSAGRTGLLYQAQKPSGRRIVYLHGAGEFGKGIEGLFRHPGLPSLLDDGLELELDVIIPCGPATGAWEPEWIDSFLESVDAGLSPATTRYHLMGYSRGCTGVYRYAAYRPMKVASIVALSGKKVLDAVADIQHIPVLLIHGEQDAQIPVSESEEMYEALRSSGDNVRFIRDSGDHYIPGRIFLKDEIYLWQCGVA